MTRYAKKSATKPVGDFERKKLEVNFFLVLAIAMGLTVGIYAIALPFKASVLGKLLYERGFTQYLVIGLASIVAVLSAIKFFKLQHEKSAFRRSWIPETIDWQNPRSNEILSLQRILAKNNFLLPIRCNRILSAYIETRSRKVATELALDDSAFYQSASDSFYTVPRILVWAIPLLGFIGTVIGISQAVGGFEGVLDQAGDVDQIKEGISNVTSGLAIAFDTTLLALLLSVIVMIPLVLVERMESRLLLAIEIFINDRLLSHFLDSSESVDEATMHRVVAEALQDNLPSPEALIEPAHAYVKEAGKQLVGGFVTEIVGLQKISEELIGQIHQINQLHLDDRQALSKVVIEQRETNREVTDNLQAMIETLTLSQSKIVGGLTEQSAVIREQLLELAQVLETRISSLESATQQIGEVAKLQESLEQLILSLEKTERFDAALLEMRQTLLQLKPALERLSKPRILTFVDSEEG